MLNEARVATRLPAQDLDRARRFYAEKLGLEPAEEREGGLRYECGQGVFALFLSQPGELPDSYQRYLVNGLREPFGLEGVPIRLVLRGSSGKNPYEDD